ncbi:MAG TPA: HEAT repeat domain-containing protein [Gemmataceae bacterium]|nr:HEAT repeat domain-containing protein [Gemmataceae bacterium]
MKTLLRGLVLGVACCVAAAAQAADVTKLVADLKSNDSDVRRAAAKGLAEMGPDAKPAAPALITALKNDKDLFVRRFAAQALGEVEADPKTAVPALSAVLKEEDKKELVEAAVTSLGKMGQPAVPPLIDALKNKAAAPNKDKKKGPAPADPTAFVRTKAAEALGNIGPKAKAAVPALTDALRDANVRTEAAIALGNIGPDAKDAVPALQDAAKAKGNKKDKGFKQAVNDAVKKIQAKD